jgi:DHA1 family tetracycline resistance protein-like MFS transporter
VSDRGEGIPAGVCGASYVTANAYISDISSPEQRARQFGLIGAAWGIGFVLGPVIGGLLGEVHSCLPFFVAAALAVVNFTYGYFILPESLKPENRRAFSLKRANPVGALLQIRRYPVVLGLLAALLCYQIAHDANPSTWAFYTIEKFHWSAAQIGFSIGVVGFAFAIVMGVLIGPIIARIGERRAVYLGFALFSAGFIGFSLAPNGAIFCALILPFSLGGMAHPALRSILSRQVPADAQGELQGAMASMQSLTAIVAPLIMTQLFRHFTAADGPYFPGAPFLTAGVLAFTSLCIAAYVIQTKLRDEAVKASPALVPEGERGTA